MANTPNLGFVKFTDYNKVKRDDWNLNIRLIDTALLNAGDWNQKVCHNHSGSIGNAPKIRSNDITLSSSVLKSTTVEGALDELQSLVDNKKLAIVNAIGSPSVPTESLTQLAGDINTGKADLAAAITAEGVNCSPTETLVNIGTKISQIRFDGVPLISNAEPTDVYSGKTYIAHTALTETGTKAATDQSIKTYTGSTVQQTIPAGLYRTGSKLNVEPNLLQENIVSGKEIFGVTGTFVPAQGLFLNQVVNASTNLIRTYKFNPTWNYSDAGQTAADVASVQDVLEYASSPYHRHIAFNTHDNDADTGVTQIINSLGQKVKELPGNSYMTPVKMSAYNELTIYRNLNYTAPYALQCYDKNTNLSWTYNTMAAGELIIGFEPLNDGTVIIVTRRYITETTSYEKKLKRLSTAGSEMYSITLTDDSTSTDWYLVSTVDKSKVYLYSENIYEINVSTGALTLIYDYNVNVCGIQFDAAGNWYITIANYADGGNHALGLTIQKRNAAKSLVWSYNVGAVYQYGYLMSVKYDTGDMFMVLNDGIHVFNANGIDHGLIAASTTVAPMSDVEGKIYVIYTDYQTSALGFKKTTLMDSYKVVYPTRYEESATGWAYTVAAGTNNWTTVSNAIWSSGSAKKATYNNVGLAYANMTVSGTGIRIYLGKGPDCGKVAIEIDGVNKGTFDLYQSTALKSALVYEILDLTNGSHTVKLTLQSEKNASSTGMILYVDYIDVII